MKSNPKISDYLQYFGITTILIFMMFAPSILISYVILKVFGNSGFFQGMAIVLFILTTMLNIDLLKGNESSLIKKCSEAKVKIGWK